MIKKETILKTAMAYWSEDDECFIVESALFDRVAGTGDTVDEARKMHKEMLDDMYESLVREEVAGYKVGRPQKPGTAINCKVREATYDAIKQLGADHDISMGEALDIMTQFFLARRNEKPTIPKADEILRRLGRLERRLNESGKSANGRNKNGAKLSKVRSANIAKNRTTL